MSAAADLSLYDLSNELFDPACIDRPCNIVVIADQRVGKTTLCSDLLIALNLTLHLDIAVAVTTSEDPSYFANILEDSLILRNVAPNVTALNLMQFQKKTQKVDMGKVPRCAAVFDNVFFANADFKGMSQYFLNSRTANILSIFTTTDPSVLPKQLQDNTDYVFIARSMRATTRKKCWQTFGDLFEKYEEFNDALSELGKHSFLAIDKNSRSKNVLEIVSSYTPVVYLAKPITSTIANAYGKWYLLPGKLDESSKDDMINTFDPDSSSKEDIEVHEHVVFTITDPGIKVGLLTTLGVE